MNFLLGRDGNFSLIRVGVIGAVVGIIFIVGGILLFFVERASHQVPLDVVTYPGATPLSTVNRSDISRSVYYQIANTTADEVANFYQQKMTEFYGGGDEQCVRLPSSGNFADFDNGEPNVVPYQFSCMFDRSGFQISQYTRVNIQPGIKSNKTEGSVIVEFEQYWQR